MKELNISRLAGRLINQRMLITPSAHTGLLKQIEALLASPNIPTIGEDYIIDSTLPENAEEAGSTAIISVSGILGKDVCMEEESALGMVDVEWISDCISNCAEDPNIKNIVLNFNSPGGETCGIEELGRKISNIDEHIKPVYGWTDKMATSAAYWLLSQCRLIGMIPSSEVAGIGVYSLVLDATEQMKQNGLSMFVASSGKYKMMGHEFRSLTDEEKKILQDSTVEQHNKFKAVVQSKRPNVEAESMEGLSYEGQEAIAKGLCDVLFDSMDEYLTFINTSAVEAHQNMKSITKTKVVTSAETKVEQTPTAAVNVEVTPVIETKADTKVEATPVVEQKAEGGGYDKGYAEEAVPGVPGTTGETHVEPDGDEPDGDEDDMEECGHCQGKGKVKKAKHTEDAGAEEEEKKSEGGNYDGQYQAKKGEEEEEDESPHAPKKMELPSTADWQEAFGIKHMTSKEKTDWDTAMKNTFFTSPFNNPKP